ncbi:putative leucine--tRNA ligase [Sarcoptes scabiei]|nr:putative leucine--tRNA ligase [Sarcoptes scabiei]
MLTMIKSDSDLPEELIIDGFPGDSNSKQLENRPNLAENVAEIYADLVNSSLQQSNTSINSLALIQKESSYQTNNCLETRPGETYHLECLSNHHNSGKLLEIKREFNDGEIQFPNDKKSQNNQIKTDPDVNDDDGEDLMNLCSLESINTDSIRNKNESEDDHQEDDAPHLNPDFSLFPAKTIQMIGEQVGIELELSEEAALIVSEDVGYRLRELIHNSSQFMHHALRSKLQTKDVFNAMLQIECDIVFGHNNSLLENRNQHDDLFANIANHYVKVPEADIFVENDHCINLLNESSRIIKDPCLLPSKTHQSTESDRNFDIKWLTLTNPIFDNETNEKKSILISQYLDKLTKSLLMEANLNYVEHQKCLKIFYEDLSSNLQIKSLLCPLFCFVRDTLMNWEQISDSSTIMISFQKVKLRLTLNLINVLRSIIHNDHFIDLSLNFRFLKEFVRLLFFILFKQKPSITFENFNQLCPTILTIRSSIAHLFHQVVCKFSLPFADIQQKLIDMLCERIRTLSFHYKSSSFSSMNEDDLIKKWLIDYSILKIFSFLGFDMCLRYLVPILLHRTSTFDYYLDEYTVEKPFGLNKRMVINEMKIIVQREIASIARLLLKGFGLLLVQKYDDFVYIRNSNFIYEFFYEKFGESICTLCPILSVVPSSNFEALWHQNLRSLTQPKTIRTCLKDSSKNFSMFEKNPSKINDELSQKSLKTTMEKSSNKSKKKGSGLLESMLSTDTTKLPKNESLSMFTDSLLDSSKKQYENIFLYQDDATEIFSSDHHTQTSARSLIVFDGKRIMAQKKDEEIESRKVRHHQPPIHFDQSEWFRLTRNDETILFKTKN